MNYRLSSSTTARRGILLVPFLVAALLASLGATFHSTHILRFYNESPDRPTHGHPLPISRAKLRVVPRCSKTVSSLDAFPVAGVDLARCSDDKATTAATISAVDEPIPPPFELYQDFDLSSQLIGNETWVDLIGYRRDASHPSLSFYVDKVARKRWLPTTTNMEGMKTYVLKYGSELAMDEASQRAAIRDLLAPLHKEYAAKPTHLSCAGGVWLTKIVGNRTFVGNGKKAFRETPGFSVDLVATDLAHQLQKVQESCGRRVPESLALRNVRPGIVVEERFSSSGSGEEDNRGGMEFKVFTIWGRVWLAIQRPGMDGAVAILHRNGTNLEWTGRSDPLPQNIDWSRIIRLAEASGRHKDMFRTDIFVGTSSSSSSTKVRYVISENEIHPTEYFHVKGTQEIFDEGAKLWMAGYTRGNYKVVPNTEVPPVFVQEGMLPEDFVAFNDQKQR